MRSLTPMQIATIVPIANLNLIRDDQYHMALAHLVQDKSYAEFYLNESDKGSFVLMDNGVVENSRMPIEQIFYCAEKIHADEFILPDAIYNREETITLGLAALRATEKHGWGGQTMAVPQGRSSVDWQRCLRMMLDWDGVDSIGISRFTNKFFLDRLDVLHSAELLMHSDKYIHLLGCPGDPAEMARIEEAFPGRIRGVDSGIASIFTQEGKRMGEERKPDVELNFRGNLPVSLLRENIDYWRSRGSSCSSGDAIWR